MGRVVISDPGGDPEELRDLIRQTVRTADIIVSGDRWEIYAEASSESLAKTVRKHVSEPDVADDERPISRRELIEVLVATGVSMDTVSQAVTAARPDPVTTL